MIDTRNGKTDRYLSAIGKVDGNQMDIKVDVHCTERELFPLYSAMSAKIYKMLLKDKNTNEVEASYLLYYALQNGIHVVKENMK